TRIRIMTGMSEREFFTFHMKVVRGSSIGLKLRDSFEAHYQLWWYYEHRRQTNFPRLYAQAEAERTPEAITARALRELQISRARERLGERLLLVQPELSSIGLLDFHRAQEAIEAGREAAKAAIPKLQT
ncbi:MAG: hypothetical protein ACK42E_04335, partial [Candidatus Bipolaricaulaceae bacterium]